jgi:hypothetical protein
MTGESAVLEVRPNCELCDRDLPPACAEARICTYECTYCAQCVETVLKNVCPTCGGNFVPRPIRPRKAWRPQLRLGLGNHPAGDRRRHSKWSRAEISALAAQLEAMPPQDR